MHSRVRSTDFDDFENFDFGNLDQLEKPYTGI